MDDLDELRAQARNAIALVSTGKGYEGTAKALAVCEQVPEVVQLLKDSDVQIRRWRTKAEGEQKLADEAKNRQQQLASVIRLIREQHHHDGQHCSCGARKCATRDLLVATPEELMIK